MLVMLRISSRWWNTALAVSPGGLPITYLPSSVLLGILKVLTHITVINQLLIAIIPIDLLTRQVLSVCGDQSIGSTLWV